MTRKEWDALWEKIDTHAIRCYHRDCDWAHQRTMIERAVRKAYRGKR